MQEGSNGLRTMSLPVWFYLNLNKTTGVRHADRYGAGIYVHQWADRFQPRVQTCIAYGVYIHTDTCFGHWDSSI